MGFLGAKTFGGDASAGASSVSIAGLLDLAALTSSPVSGKGELGSTSIYNVREKSGLLVFVLVTVDVGEGNGICLI